MTSEPDEQKPTTPEESNHKETVEPDVSVPSDLNSEGASQEVGKPDQRTDAPAIPTQTPVEPASESAEEKPKGGTSASMEAPSTEPPHDSSADIDQEEQARLIVEGENQAVLARSRRHTRRSFMVASAAVAAGYGLYHWLDTLPAEGRQKEGYRKAFELNAQISRAVFDDRALAPTYPLSKAENLRVNGVYGLKMMLDPASYRLQVVGSSATASDPRYSRDVTAWQYVYLDKKAMEDAGHDTKTPPPSARTSEKMPPAGMVEQEKKNEDRSGRLPRGKEEAGESYSTLPVGTPGLLLMMEDILKLPRYEFVTQFKCIEGWSQIVHWAGVRMVDFMEAYPPALVDGREPRYVYMETPDGDYYNGYDFHVCRHPQTLLVTEMMGAPLTQYHGAPLASAHAHEVWIQADQTDRAHQLYRQ